MLLARVHTGNFELLSFRNAYHGMSPYTMGLTAYASWRFPLPGVSNGIQHVRLYFEVYITIFMRFHLYSGNQSRSL